MAQLQFHPFPQFYTARLHLRQLLHHDARAIAALRSNEIVNKFLDRQEQTSLAEAKSFIDKINGGIANNEWIYWAICLPNEEDLIGTICLWNFAEDNKVAEIGFELMPSFHGKGIMQEALTAVINYSRDIGLETLTAFTHSENKASQQLLLRNNFNATNEKAADDLKCENWRFDLRENED